MGDGAEVVDQFAVGHPDAGIRERERFGRFVRSEGDAQRRIRVQDFLAAGLQELELLRGVRRVGNQLADKDFLVGVKRVDDDVEQLRDLGLELVFLRGTHNNKGKKLGGAMYRAGRGIQACNQGRRMGLGIMKHRTVVIGA